MARPPVKLADRDAAQFRAIPLSEGQRGTAAAEGTPPARAEREVTCTMHAPRPMAERVAPCNAGCKPAEGRFPRAEQAVLETDRSEESRRAEDAARKVVCKQTTKADRLKIAAVLAAVMGRHGISNARLSAIVDINEKQIRKMLLADVSIPQHLVLRLPTEMRWDYFDGLAAAAGCDPAGSASRVLARIRRERDVEAAHELEDQARALSREMARGQ